MTKQTEALKLALEALYDIIPANANIEEMRRTQHKAITAIKEALAQPEQEPVAWEQFYPDMGKPQLEMKRPWVGLTDEEVRQTLINYNMGALPHRFDCIKAIEAKLKELNT